MSDLVQKHILSAYTFSVSSQETNFSFSFCFQKVSSAEDI